MSALGSRADRLYPGLSALARAVLVLEAQNADREPDPRVHSTMPEDQAVEFNAYIAPLRGVARVVGPYALVLREELGHVRTQLALLQVLCAWGNDRAELLDYIQAQTDEPCTQHEFDQHLLEARTNFLPINVAVDAVLDARALRVEEADDPDAEETVARSGREVEAELRVLVADKRLVGRGRGKTFTVNAGSLYDWLERPTPAQVEWGRGYEVVSDAEVGWMRQSRSDLRRRVSAGPHLPADVLPAGTPRPHAAHTAEHALNEHDRHMRWLAERIQAELERIGGALGAVDVVLSEVRRILDDHDPAHPLLRESVDQSRSELAALRSLARQLITGDLAGGEPDGAILSLLRAAVEGDQH
jgi:hypothetical protein